jgi:aminoglycoside phosphotransferase (APT) family kinase protein
MNNNDSGLNNDRSAIVPLRDNLMQRALDLLNGELGKHLTLSEKLLGKSGAWAVHAPDGEQFILKVSSDTSCDHVGRTALLVEHLRRAGYPTPRWLRFGSLQGGGCYYLQERVPGKLMRSPGVYSELNHHELQLLLQVLNLHAGIALEASPDWTANVEAVALYQQGEWEVVAQSPLPAVQHLLQICRQRCMELGDPHWARGDLVHGDFGAHNVLLDDHGRILAVIDLEEAGRGDRLVDIVGLFYMAEPELISVIRREALQVATLEALTVCGIYWIVHRLYQGVRANDANLQPVAQQMLAHIDLLT